MEEGTYAWVSGPSYETSAEGKFLRSVGADVVGMSTIPEVVVAREEGLGVLVLSLITNEVVLSGDATRSIKAEVQAELRGEKVEVPVSAVVSHEEVLAMGKAKSEVMRSLVEAIVGRISADSSL
jgi:purine-nucleoside phosphorylase